MSYTVTKYPQGTFSWADFFSTDIGASKNFLTSLFGWTAQDMPTGEGRPDYTMFSLDGKYVAGGSPTFSPDMPSFWSSYITVDNVDEMAARAEKLGGKITMQAMDVLDAGRMVTLQDPTGASVSLWQPKKHIGASIVNTVGAMCWNELYTKDVSGAQKFFAELLGWTYSVDEKNNNYVTILNNGRPNGGMFTMDADMEAHGMVPNWTVYFTVNNMAESVKKIQELGGFVYMQKDISIGKIAMVADPAHTHFMILEMSVPPQEWVE